MSAVLDTPRTMTIGGRTETFRNYAHLAERADIFIEAIQRIEARMSAGGSSDDWARLADAAEALEQICNVQTEWLAEHDAQIAADIEQVRRDIRNLPLSSNTDETGEQ
ncbi:hypothetical protein BV96_03351 [Sphingomonas paucimobilis]|nr:hypothetical protein BV96_03351 [Sphingomonas paucimobilis]